MTEPTRNTTRRIDIGGYTETEFASLHSVELTNTAKRGWEVSTVKVYDNNPDRAAERAVQVAKYAESLLAESKLRRGES